MNDYLAFSTLRGLLSLLDKTSDRYTRRRFRSAVPRNKNDL